MYNYKIYSKLYYVLSTPFSNSRNMAGHLNSLFLGSPPSPASAPVPVSLAVLCSCVPRAWLAHLAIGPGFLPLTLTCPCHWPHCVPVFQGYGRLPNPLHLASNPSPSSESCPCLCLVLDSTKLPAQELSCFLVGGQEGSEDGDHFEAEREHGEDQARGQTEAGGQQGEQGENHSYQHYDQVHVLEHILEFTGIG